MIIVYCRTAVKTTFVTKLMYYQLNIIQNINRKIKNHLHCTISFGNWNWKNAQDRSQMRFINWPMTDHSKRTTQWPMNTTVPKCQQTYKTGTSTWLVQGHKHDLVAKMCQVQVICLIWPSETNASVASDEWWHYCLACITFYPGMLFQQHICCIALYIYNFILVSFRHYLCVVNSLVSLLLNFRPSATQLITWPNIICFIFLTSRNIIMWNIWVNIPPTGVIS